MNNTAFPSLRCKQFLQIVCTFFPSKTCILLSFYGPWVFRSRVAPNPLFWLANPTDAVAVHRHSRLCIWGIFVVHKLKELYLGYKRGRICQLWWSSTLQGCQSPSAVSPCTPTLPSPHCLGCSQRDRHPDSRRPCRPCLECCRWWWYKAKPWIQEIEKAWWLSTRFPPHRSTREREARLQVLAKQDRWWYTWCLRGSQSRTDWDFPRTPRKSTSLLFALSGNFCLRCYRST